MGLFFDSRNKGVYGSARYMGFFEESLYLSRFHNGLMVGNHARLSKKDSYMNLFVLGPTGSGKSTKIYIKNLLNLKNACAVITDPSGEIFQKTSGYLAEQRFDIKVFNPLRPEQSRCFNPLKHLDTDKELKQFAQFIVEQRAKGKEDVFWDFQAIIIINIVFHIQKRFFAKKHINLANTAWIIDKLNRPDERKKFEKLLCNKKTDRMILNKWKWFKEQDERVFLGAISTAGVSLDYWTESQIAKMTSTDTIELENLRDKKTVLYVMTDEDDAEYYQPLLNTFYSALFKATLKGTIPKAKKDIFFFLDEFGNLGKIRGFPSIVTTSRKKRASFCMSSQDRYMIDDLYGAYGAKQIYYGGTMHKLYLGGLSNPDTLKELQTLLGTRTVVDISKNGNSRKLSQNLENISDLRMIPDHKAILISKNRKPCRIRSTPYFWNVVYWWRSREKPYEIALNSHRERIEYVWETSERH